VCFPKGPVLREVKISLAHVSFLKSGRRSFVHIVTLKICDEISYDSLGNLIFFRLFSSINSSNSDYPIYLSVGTVADPTL